ncbi:MAG TPA: hypothetical protein VJS43_07900 [Candidatus Acidoferrales bacterium]|nr:hypothetical protein [Candidatus Acidoferrales bacterium]
MIQEATSPQYRAVLCRHCREPIPVPAIVIRMETLSSAEEPGSESERVFTVRCRSCECEHPYRSSQIIQVEGQPKARRGPAGTIYRHGTLSRAASA